MHGLVAAADWLMLQAVGSKRNDLVLLHLNRFRFLMTIFYIPAIYIFYHIDTILLALGQTKTASELAKRYVVTFTPGLVLYGYTEAHRRYLNAHNYIVMPFVVMMISFATHIGAGYVLIHKMKRGIEGAAMAGVVSNATCFAIQHFYACCFISIEDEELPSVDSCDMRIFDYDGVLSYAGIAVHTILTCVIDWWSFQLMLLVAARINVQAQATMIVLMNIMQVLSKVGMALGWSADFLISEQLRVKNVFEAK